MASILVSGMAKTGTTGLYNAIKEAVDPSDDHACLFEPRAPDALLALSRYAPHRPVLTKIMLSRLDDCAVRYDDFDHRFMTVRDPRDVVVSRLLFRPMFGWGADELPVDALRGFVAALEEKERDPGSYSVRALHALADDLGLAGGGWEQSLVRLMDRQLEVTTDRGFTPVAYEDFVEGRLDAVGERLGVAVTNPDAESAGGWLDHIRRSMAHGEWRHWFTAEDVDHFRELFGDRVEAFGYHDWELADQPTIAASASSRYVAHKARARHARLRERNRRGSVAELTSQEELERLRGPAEDGRAKWALELARVHREGAPRWRDAAEARRWAREAAVRGHAGGMGLLAELLAEEGTRESRTEARHWRCERDRLTGRQAETSDGLTLADLEHRARRLPEIERQVAGLERRTATLERRLSRARARARTAEQERDARARELRGVKRSTRYRVGSLLAEGARHPRHLPRVLVRLVRLARQGRC